MAWSSLELSAEGEHLISISSDTTNLYARHDGTSRLLGIAGSNVTADQLPSAGPCSLGPELQKVAGGPANGHFNESQRKLLAALESANEEGAEVKGVAVRGGRGKGKPVRHSLHRTPTPTQQARWEAVQQAREKGLSLRAIAQKLGMSRDTAGKYAKAKRPPTKRLSAKE